MTFTGNNYDLHKQEVVPILKFDRSKFSIKKLEDNNFKILSSNKLLFVSIKAFCALVKRGRDFTRNKYIKVKNPLVSSKLWDVFSNIHLETCYKACSIAFFYRVNEGIKVLLERNEKLPHKKTIFFEDCIIFFGKVITKAFDNFYYFVNYKVIKSKMFTWLNIIVLLTELLSDPVFCSLFFHHFKINISFISEINCPPQVELWFV